MKRFTLAVLFSFIFAASAGGQEMPADYKMVREVLERGGDYKAGVLKVNVPRGMQVRVAAIALPMPFGFSGWVAFTKGDAGMDVMMGDLVLLEDEVNPVMSALLENGIEVTALHNHFFWEQPRVFYMHVHGHGKAEELARKLKPALDLIPKAVAAPGASSFAGQLDGARLSKIIGYSGEQNGTVYKITIGRDDIGLKEMGATINARMGLNTWAAFYGAMEDAVVAGDVAMLEGEVTPVLNALRQNGLQVVAIHHHMIGTRPMVIFLHYWGRGRAEKLASGIRAALEKTKTTRKP
ncbi:MAG: DUF1259 domain-containing protein [Acidobacteria bacterium]|nr:DUF1259 domain-containing protein [Acidobacteriota bacterium]MBI3646876.1 DUF1259 domain-containing protein [Terriglobales bacterium]